MIRSLFCVLATLALFAAPCRAQQAAKASEAFFKKHDHDGDGKLLRKDFPERVRHLFDRIDADEDGVLTREEDAAFRQRRQDERKLPRQPARPDADYANVTYGPDERNVLDIWVAKSDEPTPLVIFYHGGGFRGGDKRSLNAELLKGLREGGVSVAAVNYRLSGTAPFPAQMHDCARALQFLRLHAKKYNIDPTHVGATGGSAGAGISQWLAFHDDLADPDSADPVERQSTRLSCAVVYAAQTTYDPRAIKELFNTTEVDGALIPFYGMKSAADVDDPKFHPLFEEASPMNHLTADDVPVMLFYPQANTPLPENSPGKQHIHHPKFGIVLKEKMDELGIECVVKFREDYSKEGGRVNPVKDYVRFFLDKLGAR